MLSLMPSLANPFPPFSLHLSSNHKWTLRKLTGQKIRGLDFSDDRLALCLRYISSDAVWEQIEERLVSV